MDQRRFLIINADDFGMCGGVNRGIAIAHERGVLTSASFMVRHDSASEAARYAHAHPSLSVGLHVDLVQWSCRDYNWTLDYQVTDLDDEPAVEAEVRRQLEKFRTLLGRDPTHLDSHQHVHRGEPAHSVMTRLAN